MGVSRDKLKRWGLCAALGSALSLSLPLSVQARDLCGDFYRVKQGDTLMTITIENLGHRRYTEVFRANRDILPAPEKIETGQLLFMPCRGKGPADRAAALQEAGRQPTDRDNLGDRFASSTEGATFSAITVDREPPAEAVSKTPVPGGQRFLLLTSSGFAPLAAEQLPGGGLASVLLQHALAASQGGFISKLAFVNDRKAHLHSLMPSGAFALGFPWPKPDCGNAALSAESALLCKDFVFSRPLYEMEMALIARSSAAAPAKRDMANQRVCRPAGFPPVEWQGLAERPEFVHADDAEGCMTLLRNGSADFVSLPAPWSEPYKGAAEFVERTEMLPASARKVLVHAIAWRGSPDAELAIASLDEGLRQLQSSGEWFRIVSDYLSDYNFRMAALQRSN